MADMKWVPVTERLPERSGEYLVTITNHKGEISVDREDYFFDVWTGRKFRSSAIAIREAIVNLNYRMPLPEPYDPNN